MAQLATIPTVTLSNGVDIPQLGYGVFLIPPAQTLSAVMDALEAGYRHIDTAEMYGNEYQVGAAVRASGLPRDQVFITSKLNNGAHRPDDARRAFETTLETLRMEYVDLFLIHWPLPTLYEGDFVSTWRVLSEFERDGRARAVGVSNFQVEHLERLARETDLVPRINQIEAHPYIPNDVVRSYCRQRGIAIEAWSPIARGQVLRDPVVHEVATAVGRTPAQVVLRWHIQRGDIVFPKSVSSERMRQNMELFDFELSAGQMASLTALDRGDAGRTGPHPDSFAGLPA